MNQIFPLALSYDDVLLVPQYSDIKSRSLVDLTTQITSKVKLRIPLISINMQDVTGVDMAIKLGNMGGLGFLPRFETSEKQADMVKKVKNAGLIAAAAIGCKDGFMERAEILAKAGVDILTIDVAHGHMKSSIDATRELKRRYGKYIEIISGVIATKSGAEDLFKAGADSVRVGVGPGTICITRIVTGVGVPQFSALLDASKAARKYKKTILADGGIKNSGDAAKALAAGASAVVMGSIFAGTDEAPGELIEIDGQKYKAYNASTSYEEKKKHVEKIKNELNHNYINHIEGVESLVKCKGPVENIISQYNSNLRSSLSYAGAKNIEEFWKKARFVQVTSSGLKENGAHDVILKDSINLDKHKVRVQIDKCKLLKVR